MCSCTQAVHLLSIHCLTVQLYNFFRQTLAVAYVTVSEKKHEGFIGTAACTYHELIIPAPTFLELKVVRLR